MEDDVMDDLFQILAASVFIVTIILVFTKGSDKE